MSLGHLDVGKLTLVYDLRNFKKTFPGLFCTVIAVPRQRLFLRGRYLHLQGRIS